MTSSQSNSTRIVPAHGGPVDGEHEQGCLTQPFLCLTLMPLSSFGFWVVLTLLPPCRCLI
jgi:hypothetical protein